MSLTTADVAEIMRLVEESSFNELTLEIDGLKINLRRGAGVAGAVGAVGAVDAADAADAAAAASTAPGPATGPAHAAKSSNVDPNVKEVASPLLGTFYRAPKPGAPPYIEVGSTVEEDTVIAIIEVMKLMNSVRAGVRGTVTEVVASDGALVEYGETLLRISKA